MSNETETRNQHLEPRVAKLEGQLDRLTEDVRSLASIVRDQGTTVEKQLSELTVAVTQAAGPRKTDWSTIIAAIMLVMAIGSAAFWPMYQTSMENKESVEQIRQEIADHRQLQLHPVGMTLVQRLESQLADHTISNRREMETHIDDAREMHATIEKSFLDKFNLVQKIHDLELSALKEKVQLHDDRLYGRVVKLEDKNSIEIEREKDELQMWRLKAMGVTVTPNVNTHTHEVIEQSSNKK